MKKRIHSILFFAGIAMLTSCGNSSNENTVKDKGTESAECICKAWGAPSDSSGKKTADGFLLLDHYLLEFGFIGKGTLDDYHKFANDTARIVIPTNTDSIEKIRLVVYSGHASSDDAGAIGKCFDNLYNETKDLDKSDGLKRLGKLLYSYRETGIIDKTAFYREFFDGLTESDFKKPIFKYVFYLLLLNRIDVK
jgi:hypothetical protein